MTCICAVRVLRKVREALAKNGKSPRIRCIFVESNAGAFAELEKSIASITDMESFVAWYNESRAHSSLVGNAPELREVEGQGAFVATLVLGGVHRRYSWAAA